MMTANRRIFLNIVATYGRSLYAMACGLFAGRWTLMALGHEDYGLYGVVGGLTVFVGFLNSLMAGAVGRFYAYCVGASEVCSDGSLGVEHVREWFSTAVMIHTILPILLVAIGYPIGTCLITDFLSVPIGRMVDCIWVWRFTCFSCLVSMMNIPFSAMYTAKQEIAELTIYGVISTTLNVGCVYYMATHPNSWLVGYGAAMCFVAVVPQLLIFVRAVIRFPECRFRCRYAYSSARIAMLMKFAGSRAICAFAQICSSQGVAILVNRFLGSICNAAMTIGNTVSSQTMTLAASFSTAFYPAITNAAGAGKLAYMRALAWRTCLLSSISFLVFAIPLSLELEEVMLLWLKEPPPSVVGLCRLLLATAVLERLCDGHWMSLLAIGRIARFQVCDSIAYFSAVIFVVLGLIFGGNLLSVGWAFLIAKLISVGVKLVFAQKEAKMSIRYWVTHIVSPLFCVSGVSFLIGLVPFELMESSFIRVCVTTIVVEFIFIPMLWIFVLGDEERRFVGDKIKKLIGK